MSQTLVPGEGFLQTVSTLSTVAVISIKSFLVYLIRLQQFILLSYGRGRHHYHLEGPDTMYVAYHVQPLFI